jgi:hypothetical protein
MHTGEKKIWWGFTVYFPSLCLLFGAAFDIIAA